MPVSVDVSELRALATDLGRAADKVQRGVRPVVSKGALNVKNDLQSQLRSSRSFRGIARSPSFDIRVDAGGVGAEIGPDKSRFGGALANIAMFGTSRGGGTVPDPVEALQREADRFEQALADLIGDAL